MRAISIKEPWASLILNGKKTIETRTWTTKYRGKLLLCCSKNPKSDISGKAFMIVDLVECEPMVKADEVETLCPYKPGLYSWVLNNFYEIDPFDVTGQLRLFDIEMPKNPPPKGYLDISDDQTWRPCLRCGKSALVQVRKALWTCCNCDQEYISVEEDMRPDGYPQISQGKDPRTDNEGGKP